MFLNQITICLFIIIYYFHKWFDMHVIVVFTFTFTFSHLADAFIQSDLQLGSGTYSVCAPACSVFSIFVLPLL